MYASNLTIKKCIFLWNVISNKQESFNCLFNYDGVVLDVINYGKELIFTLNADGGRKNFIIAEFNPVKLELNF